MTSTQPRRDVVIYFDICHCQAHTWDSAIAEHYGSVRADMERQGKMLAPLDLLIAAHALSVGAALVTNDRAFSQVAELQVEDWTD